MSISVTVHDSEKIIKIAIIGSFDFSLFDDFRSAYSDYIGLCQAYVVDMSLVEYLDSAALGMLLSMRNAVGADCVIELKGANEFIKNILMISRFDKRFDIQ